MSSKISLQGELKQFSGNPFTILENTWANIALTNFVFKFKDHQFGGYKGDDSSNCCTSSEMTAEGTKFLLMSKHKLKCSNSKVGEFASFILTDAYVGPDLYRRTAKFVGNMYRNQKHFDEAKIALKSTTDLIASETELNNLALATSIHYGNRINPEEVKILFSFLKNTVPKMKFEELKYVQRKPVVLDSDTSTFVA